MSDNNQSQTTQTEKRPDRVTFECATEFFNKSVSLSRVLLDRHTSGRVKLQRVRWLSERTVTNQSVSKSKRMANTTVSDLRWEMFWEHNLLYWPENEYWISVMFLGRQLLAIVSRVFVQTISWNVPQDHHKRRKETFNRFG